MSDDKEESGTFAWLGNFLDIYEIVARLAPACLTILPGVLFLWLVVFNEIVPDLKWLWNSLFSVGPVILVTLVARWFGLRLQDKLQGEWGGLPTTLLLRHEDSAVPEKLRLTSPTKDTYRTALSKMIGRELPSAEEEHTDQKAADGTYELAVATLREQTRDTKKYKLVHKENRYYGFARNLVGLKIVGVPICLLVLAFIAGKSFIDGFDLVFDDDGWLWSGIVALVVLAIWLVVLRKALVTAAAYGYADALLRTLLADKPANEGES